MLPFANLIATSELFRPIRILSIRSLTSDAKLFDLEPLGWELAYKPGQFLTFVISTPSGLVRRSYSLCSVPGETPAIVVKRVPNGVFSRPMLETAQPGDLLTVAGGASGFFTVPEVVEAFDRLLFFAAGSGITPVYPMIKSVLKANPHIPVWLAYSNSRMDSALFRHELEELERRYAERLSITWFYSNLQDLMKARLSKASLEHFLPGRMKGEPARNLAFLCGPFDYMRMAAIVLQSAGMPPENIRREVFTPVPLTTKTPPPDTHKHRVTIQTQGKVHELDVQYPATILSAARSAGIELPYSCESGRCGSCIAACTKGKVWMRYNEVLTDREVAAGRILVCQSFPTGGDVTIKYE